MPLVRGGQVVRGVRPVGDLGGAGDVLEESLAVVRVRAALHDQARALGRRQAAQISQTLSDDDLSAQMLELKL